MPSIGQALDDAAAALRLRREAADAELRHRAMTLLARTEGVAAARDACGHCGICEECHPDVAVAAMEAGVPFMAALVYALEVREAALADLVAMKKPATSRAARREQQRFAAKARKRGHRWKAPGDEGLPWRQSPLVDNAQEEVG